MTKTTGKRLAGFLIFLAALSLFAATETASKLLIAVSVLLWAAVAVVHFLPKKEDE